MIRNSLEIQILQCSYLYLEYYAVFCAFFTLSFASLLLPSCTHVAAKHLEIA